MPIVYGCRLLLSITNTNAHTDFVLEYFVDVWLINFGIGVCFICHFGRHVVDTFAKSGDTTFTPILLVYKWKFNVANLEVKVIA